MEKIMSKTKNTLNLVTFDDRNALADSELNAVAGGSISWTYTKQKQDGTAGGNVAAKWSLTQGAAA
jgi:hypothetical protein